MNRTESGATDAAVRPDLDEWVASVGADVAIDHHGPAVRRSVESILVPIAGGPYSYYAAGLAATLARRWDASLELLTVVPAAADNAERMAASARLGNFTSEFDDVLIRSTLLARDDVTGAIAERAQTHDVISIGASDRSFLRRIFRGTIPDRLTDRTDVPVFVVRGDAEDRS